MILIVTDNFYNKNTLICHESIKYEISLSGNISILSLFISSLIVIIISSYINNIKIHNILYKAWKWLRDQCNFKRNSDASKNILVTVSLYIFFGITYVFYIYLKENKKSNLHIKFYFKQFIN